MENARNAIDLAVVDDDPLYRDYVCALLGREGIRTFPAATGADLLRILNEKRIDCVVIRLRLGSETGLNLAEEVRSRVTEPPPIVMLTGGGGERTAVKAFRGGFSDYVSKRNLDPEELVYAIRGAVERTSAQQADRAAQERLSRLSAYDDETGLLARHRVDEILADVQSRASRRGGTFALIAIRLFGFDQLKDQFGHILGHRALLAFATRLKGAARATDICGRYGEADFVCILDRDPKPQTVQALCDQLARD